MKYNFYFLLFLLNIFGNDNLCGSDNPAGIFEAVKKCGHAIMQNSGKIAESIKQHGSKFEWLGDKAGKVFSDMATAAMAVTILKFGKEVVVETKEYFRPGHDRRLKKVTEEMNLCLFDFQTAQKREDGMPIACENQLHDYAKLAGPVALSKVKKAFTSNL